MPNGNLCETVVELSVDGLMVIDVNGIVQFANPAAVALFRGKPSALVGSHLGSPAIDRPVEIILPGDDGLRYVEMRSTEISWLRRPASLASLRDITEGKNVLEALRASAENLRERNAELVRFNQAVAGRELRMLELKAEVNDLCRRLGEPTRHRIQADEITRPPQVASKS